MQHNRDQFDDAEPIRSWSYDVEIRPYADFKRQKAIDQTRIEIRQIDMASRRIMDDYPEFAAWFCFMVKPYAEFSTEQALKDVNIEALVPTRIGEEIRRRGRLIPGATLPVLPGYVLVRCVQSPSAIAGLLRFKKVIGVVGDPEKPYRVPDQIMARFIEKAADGGYDFTAPEPEIFDVGQKVRVIDGPFASFPGIVIDWDGLRGRIRVEVSIFGRETPVELLVAQVEKV